MNIQFLIKDFIDERINENKMPVNNSNINFNYKKRKFNF
jgi:hypothetical protein